MVSCANMGSGTFSMTSTRPLTDTHTALLPFVE